MSDVTTMSSPNEGIPQEPLGPSAWPMVLGVIGIIWASLGLLCNLYGVLGPSAGSLGIGFTVVGFILSIWLLFGSIKLLRRDASSRPVLITWSVIAILYVIASTAFSFSYAPEITEQILEQQRQIEQGDPSQEGMAENEDFQQTIGGLVLVATGCSGVLGCVWPVLLLIFLNTASNRREVETWSDSILGTGGEDV